MDCRRFVCLVVSLLVLRAGCEIWLCRFLIIAYLFTSHICTLNTYIHYMRVEMGFNDERLTDLFLMLSDQRPYFLMISDFFGDSNLTI